MLSHCADEWGEYDMEFTRRCLSVGISAARGRQLIKRQDLIEDLINKKTCFLVRLFPRKHKN